MTQEIFLINRGLKEAIKSSRLLETITYIIPRVILNFMLITRVSYICSRIYSIYILEKPNQLNLGILNFVSSSNRCTFT